MKKAILVFLALFSVMIMSAETVRAAADLCDESNGGTSGLVPCGRKSDYRCVGKNPATGTWQYWFVAPPATCSSTAGTFESVYQDTFVSLKCRCEIAHIFLLLKNLFRFVLLYITIPLAGLLVVTGGVLLMISGGGAAPIPGAGEKTSLYSTGKKMVTSAIFSVVLIFCSWLIMNIVLRAIGYVGVGSWWNPF